MHYVEIFNQWKKMLGQLDKWLGAAIEHATAKKFDPNVLIEARLAPDQFAFVRQVQAATDMAKLGASRMTGKEAPKFEDNETTIEQLRERVKKTIAFLDTLSAKDFEGADDRTISTPRWEGKTMRGADYFLEHAMPNFFFHITHAYALLRHNGVTVGKRDYLGALSLRDPAPATS